MNHTKTLLQTNSILHIWSHWILFPNILRFRIFEKPLWSIYYKETRLNHKSYTVHKDKLGLSKLLFFEKISVCEKCFYWHYFQVMSLHSRNYQFHKPWHQADLCYFIKNIIMTILTLLFFQLLSCDKSWIKWIIVSQQWTFS